mgnify:FL=1
MADLAQVLKKRQERKSEASHKPQIAMLLPIKFREAPSLRMVNIGEVVRFLSSAKVVDIKEEEILVGIESINVIPKEEIAGEESE